MARANRRGIGRRAGGQFDRPLRGRTGSGVNTSALPLVHATSVWNAKEVVAQGKLITKLCKVFGKPLIYFFVLRPAYLQKEGDTPNHRISAFPAAFIFNTKAVASPFHLYPFDTGAATAGAFDQQADRQIPLDDYALDPTHAGASNFIAWAFGDLSSYFDGRVRNDLSDEIRLHDCVAVSYLDIARMGIDGSNIHDKRASSLELAADHNVDLPAHLELAVLPKQFVEENDEFLKRLQSFGTHIALYDWQPNRAPNEFQRDLMDIAQRWYRENGLAL